MSRRHNDANVACFGARVLSVPRRSCASPTACSPRPFEGGRHATRVEKINALDRARSARSSGCGLARGERPRRGPRTRPPGLVRRGSTLAVPAAARRARRLPRRDARLRAAARGDVRVRAPRGAAGRGRDRARGTALLVPQARRRRRRGRRRRGLRLDRRPAPRRGGPAQHAPPRGRVGGRERARTRSTRAARRCWATARASAWRSTGCSSTPSARASFVALAGGVRVPLRPRLSALRGLAALWVTGERDARLPAAPTRPSCSPCSRRGPRRSSTSSCPAATASPNPPPSRVRGMAGAARLGGQGSCRRSPRRAAVCPTRNPRCGGFLREDRGRPGARPGRDPRRAHARGRRAADARPGHTVAVERGGRRGGRAPRPAYEKAGARVGGRAARSFADADLVVRVLPPTPEEVAALPDGATVLGLPVGRAERRERAGAGRARGQRVRDGARAAHHARADDGRALLDEHGGRLPRGAARRADARRGSSPC